MAERGVSLAQRDQTCYRVGTRFRRDRMFRQSRNAARGFLAATLIVAAALSAARQVRAQSGRTRFEPPLTVSIVSRANGGGAPGQTLQAGVFAVTNNLNITQTVNSITVNSITIAFSNPSMFSSATLTPPAARFDVNNNTGSPAPPTVSNPGSSTTFTFKSPIGIGPGGEAVFALTVKLSPLSRNETNGVAYAGVMEDAAARGAGAPLWMAFAMLGLAMAALPGGTRRHVWLLAALLILLAADAPGCGGDSSSGPSSTQTVTAVAAEVASRPAVNAVILPAGIAGLLLKLGTITGQ
jgi:hypothetical protein